MLDIKFIRENRELVEKNNQNRSVEVDLGALLDLDEKRRAIQHEVDKLRALRKKSSKGKPRAEEIALLRDLGDEIAAKEKEQTGLEKEFGELLNKIPNLTHPDAPVGGEDDYKVLEVRGKIPSFSFPAKTHEELMTGLDLLDFGRGAKVAAAKFYFLKKDAVLLNEALIRYARDIVIKHGYMPIETPDIAKNQILQGIGFQPRGPETQVYSIENTDLSLIGTAEITMGGYHADEVLDLTPGAKKYVAISHCFRTEAGSYGKAMKGLYRVHQFTKLEMFVYCKPEESEKYHQEILGIEKEICDGLDLAYRVIDTASGDLGGPAYRKYDLEAWMTMNAKNGHPGDYGEITSTSNCTDYQARGLNIKFRRPDGSTDFVHTLNGTALATSRVPLAIVEQNQQADGSIKIPKVLRDYYGKKVIERK